MTYILSNDKMAILEGLKWHEHFKCTTCMNFFCLVKLQIIRYQNLYLDCYHLGLEVDLDC